MSQRVEADQGADIGDGSHIDIDMEERELRGKRKYTVKQNIKEAIT